MDAHNLPVYHSKHSTFTAYMYYIYVSYLNSSYSAQYFVQHSKIAAIALVFSFVLHSKGKIKS